MRFYGQHIWESAVKYTTYQLLMTIFKYITMVDLLIILTIVSHYQYHTNSSLKNRLRPNLNGLPRSVKFQPAQEKLGYYVKPRNTVNIGAFNVRTLIQIGQQASLVMTLASLNLDICCISETRIQDPSTVLRLTCPTNIIEVNILSSVTGWRVNR